MKLNFVLFTIIVLINKASSLSYNDVGKCKNVATNPSFILAPSNKVWNVLYVLDTPKGRTTACSKSKITQNQLNGRFYVNTTTIGVDGSKEEIETRRFDIRQGRIKEFAVGENGTQLEFNLYFLKDTGCNTSVFYRCSDHGTLIYDVRYIISTEESISSDCLTKSLAIANGQNLLGKQFIKLPNPPDLCQAI